MTTDNGHDILADMARTRADAPPQLEHLRDLPFVQDAEVLEWQPEGIAGGPDAVLLVRTATGDAHRFLVEQTGSFPTYAFLHELIARHERGDGGQPWMLWAPRVTTEQGLYLREAGVRYVDAAGNCHVALGTGQVALVDGLKLPQARRDRDRGIRAPGYKILFALLARPELFRATVRDIAAQAGAGKTAVARLLRQLADEQVLGKAGNAWRLLERDRLLRRWLEGYATTLRPHLLIGRYQTADRTTDELETRIAGELTDQRWAWGGAAAANRIDGYYRGDQTVLHVERNFDVTSRLRALRDVDGPLIVLRAPGPVAFDGPEPHVVHPLLVYAEMLQATDPRTLEAAERIRERFVEVPD